jgi:hypothetical protein
MAFGPPLEGLWGCHSLPLATSGRPPLNAFAGGHAPPLLAWGGSSQWVWPRGTSDHLWGWPWPLLRARGGLQATPKCLCGWQWATPIDLGWLPTGNHPFSIFHLFLNKKTYFCFIYLYFYYILYFFIVIDTCRLSIGCDVTD